MVCRSRRSPVPRRSYKITPRQLAAAITPKTRLVLLNSPSNPTGAAYTRAELRALADVLVEHPRIIIGTDDMYEKIFLGQRAVLQPADRRAGALQPHGHDQRRVEARLFGREPAVTSTLIPITGFMLVRIQHQRNQ